MEINEDILDYLGKAEGLTVHVNDGEKDITSPYGIYRSVHPNAEMFTYIDQLLMEAGIFRKTSELLHSDFDIINTIVERNEIVSKEIRRLASKFYAEYYADTYLYLMPKETQLAFLSCYTTSEYGGKKSLQAAINDLISNREIQNNRLIEDGVFGSKTQTALIKVKNRYNEIKEKKYFGLWFEEKLLRHMIMYYDKLAIENPKEYKKFYKGWRNRMEALADSK